MSNSETKFAKRIAEETVSKCVPIPNCFYHMVTILKGFYFLHILNVGRSVSRHSISVTILLKVCLLLWREYLAVSQSRKSNKSIIDLDRSIDKYLTIEVWKATPKLALVTRFYSIHMRWRRDSNWKFVFILNYILH